MVRHKSSQHEGLKGLLAIPLTSRRSDIISGNVALWPQPAVAVVMAVDVARAATFVVTQVFVAVVVGFA